MSLAFNEPRFDIEASDFRCRPCGAEVPCEGAYYSAILLEEGALRRSNYCAACWAAGPPAGEVFAFWRTRRPALPTDKPRKVRFDPAVIFEFFRRLEAPAGPPDAETETPPRLLADSAERDELRFVLALLLVRKKVLDFRSSAMKDGAEWLQLELRGVPGAAAEAPEPPLPPKTHWVRNPQLADSELERVKGRIGELLQLEM